MRPPSKVAFLLLQALVAALLLRPWDFLPALAEVKPATVLILLTCLVWLADSPRVRLFADATAPWLWALLAVVVATLPFSVWPSKSVEVGFYILQQIALFTLAAHMITSVDALSRLTTVFVGCGAIHGLLAGIAYLRQDVSVDGRVFGAGSGFFSDPNDLALSLVMLFPFAWWRFTEAGRRGNRIVLAGILVAIIAGILASQSRGGLLALGAAVVVIALFARSAIVPLALVLAGAVAAVALIFPSDVFDRYSSIVHYQSDESATTRLAVWKAGLRMFADHPLTGVGAGTFEAAYGDKYLDRAEAGNVWRAAHSSYVQVTAELGIVGIVVWVAMLVSILRTIRQTQRALPVHAASDDGPPGDIAGLRAWVDAALASVVGFAVGAAFLSRAYDYLLVMIAGMAAAALRIAQEGEFPLPAEADHAEAEDVAPAGVLASSPQGA